MRKAVKKSKESNHHYTRAGAEMNTSCHEYGEDSHRK